MVSTKSWIARSRAGAARQQVRQSLDGSQSLSRLLDEVRPALQTVVAKADKARLDKLHRPYLQGLDSKLGNLEVALDRASRGAQDLKDMLAVEAIDPVLLKMHAARLEFGVDGHLTTPIESALRNVQKGQVACFNPVQRKRLIRLEEKLVAVKEEAEAHEARLRAAAEAIREVAGAKSSL